MSIINIDTWVWLMHYWIIHMCQEHWKRNIHVIVVTLLCFFFESWQSFSDLGIDWQLSSNGWQFWDFQIHRWHIHNLGKIQYFSAFFQTLQMQIKLFHQQTWYISHWWYHFCVKNISGIFGCLVMTMFKTVGQR